MPKLRPTETEQINRESRAILVAGKARQALSDEAIAKHMGVVKRTYQNRMKEPGSFTVKELRAIIKIMRLSDQEIVTLVKGR